MTFMNPWLLLGAFGIGLPILAHLLNRYQVKRTDRSAWLRGAFEDLGLSAAVCIVPVTGGPENLAITSLELVSGVLRKGTVARYRASVRNCGAGVVANVRVNGLVNNITVDTKTIGAIAAGASESVSLFVPFQNPGAVRITARLDDDALPVDNSRRAVAVIRDRVSVLCVGGGRVAPARRSDSSLRLRSALRKAACPVGRGEVMRVRKRK